MIKKKKIKPRTFIVGESKREPGSIDSTFHEIRVICCGYKYDKLHR